MSRRIRPSYISDVVGRIANEDSRFERKRREQTAFIREAGGKGFSYSVNKRLGLVKIDGLPYELLTDYLVVNPDDFSSVGEIEETDGRIRFVFEDKDAYEEHKDKARGMTEKQKEKEYKKAVRVSREDIEREKREEERERREQQDKEERQRLLDARERARFKYGDDEQGNQYLRRLLRGEQPTPLIPTGKQAELTRS